MFIGHQYGPEDLLEFERQFDPAFYSAAAATLKPFYHDGGNEYVEWMLFLETFSLYLNL